MPTIRFTDNIQRHVSCPTREVDGATVHAALDRYFTDNPRARGYALDDQGRLRQHMAVFVDGRQENGGDSWTTVSANLPPVYAVRFEKPA